MRPPHLGFHHCAAQNGHWVHDGQAKADLLAHAFSSKYHLPAEIEEADEVLADLPTKMSNFVLVRERLVLRELRNLREDQSTSPDGLPARILRQCARQLSRFVTTLIRMMLLLGRWPAMWKIHRVCPLYKKGVVYKPDNYRGLHLTPVISKVAERVIQIPFGSYLEAVDGFGSSQWAFRKERGCTDLVLLLVCSWLWAFQLRKKLECSLLTFLEHSTA